MKYVLIALALINTINGSVAVWHDDYSKATFYLITTLIWLYILEQRYPLKKEK